MATRGSKLSRALEYFETADIREARVAFQLVKETMDQRLAPTQPKLKFTRKPRKTKVAPVEGRVLGVEDQASATVA